MDINGKVALVTGGGTGIGAASAKAFAAAGANVVICGRRPEPLENVVSAIKDAGGEALAVPTDITSEDDVVKLMDTIVETYGSIDVVLANAGAIKDGLFINPAKEGGVKSVMSLDAFKMVVDINLVGTFLVFREGARRMVEAGTPGVLLITSSINATGQLGQLNYSSTKVALDLWPKCLVGEFAMRNLPIRVVGVAPGYTATEILEGMNKDALDAILKDVPIGRLISCEEIADAFLTCIENDAINGTVIEVTGGLTYGPRTRAK